MTVSDEQRPKPYHRSGADAILFFGTLFAGAIALIIVVTACYQELKGGVSPALAGWAGTIVGFYFSQLIQLSRPETGGKDAQRP